MRQDKRKRLALLLNQFDGAANCAKIVRTWPGRNQDKIGLRDHGSDCMGNRGRRIHKGQFVPGGVKAFQFGLKLCDGRGGESRTFSLTDVPPCRKRPLWIGINEDSGEISRKLGGNGEISVKVVFPLPPFWLARTITCMNANPFSCLEET